MPVPLSCSQAAWPVSQIRQVDGKTACCGLQELDQRYLGKELEVIMTEVKADRMSAVWDQRKAEDVRIERKCRPGTLHWGTVSHIKNSYGAYITLDDPHSKITGMLHISAISREHVESALVRESRPLLQQDHAVSRSGSL